MKEGMIGKEGKIRKEGKIEKERKIGKERKIDSKQKECNGEGGEIIGHWRKETRNQYKK